MSDTYTKLFSSITASTIWQEPAPTRLVWITMLAMCDKSGHVYASVPGLAHIANVSLQECESALTTLLSPDKYSRTPSFEGRRIEPIDGGWQLLNHAKFRAIRSAEERREYMREYMAKQRANKAEQLAETLAPLVDLAEVTPPAPSPDKSKRKEHVPQAARFDEFWSAYPIKRGKKTARDKWKAKKLDAVADRLIADVRKRVSADQQWRDGFAPHASTYLHQERWEDELAGRKTESKPEPPKPSSHTIIKPTPTSLTPEQCEANQARLKNLLGDLAA